MMKKLFLIFVVLLSVMPLFGQENVHSAKYTLLLTGASFASPENGWFEWDVSLWTPYPSTGR